MVALATVLIPAPPPLEIHLLSFPAQKLILKLSFPYLKFDVLMITCFAKVHHH